LSTETLDIIYQLGPY